MFPFKVKNDKKFNKIKLIKNDIYKDLRGVLFTIVNSYIQKKIIKKKFNNYYDKITIRKKNALTGIHIDRKAWKIITCIDGSILVAIVDCNRKSKNYLKHSKIKLNSCNKSIIVPPNYGVSYICTSKKCIIYYKFLFNGKYNDVEKQETISWKNKAININWPTKKPILSKRDNV